MPGFSGGMGRPPPLPGRPPNQRSLEQRFRRQIRATEATTGDSEEESEAAVFAVHSHGLRFALIFAVLVAVGAIGMYRLLDHTNASAVLGLSDSAFPAHMNQAKVVHIAQTTSYPAGWRHYLGNPDSADYGALVWTPDGADPLPSVWRIEWDNLRTDGVPASKRPHGPNGRPATHFVVIVDDRTGRVARSVWF